ncbi:MAG: hypothetical protein P8L85_23490, partial [Rubripirellula sp.]|nr:hypothetical protein [Rubripirellula sp.]
DPEIEDSSRVNLESTADLIPAQIQPVEESELELAQRIIKQDVTRLRLLNRVHPDAPLAIAAAEAFATIIDEPVLVEGRIECLRYLDEQSISYDYHRYGNLGRRFHESRRAIL